MSKKIKFSLFFIVILSLIFMLPVGIWALTSLNFSIGGEIDYIPQVFTVSWQNYDGSVLEEDEVTYTSKPIYNGTTPTRAATAQYTYTFAGWSTSKNAETGTAEANLEKVTGNKTYYAAFSKTVNSYDITWTDYNGNILKITSVAYGSTPSYGTNPTREDLVYTYYEGATAKTSVGATYAFKGWSTAQEGTTATPASVTGDATYYAVYNETKKAYTLTINQINVENNSQIGTITKTVNCGERYSVGPANQTINGVTYYVDQTTIKGTIYENTTINAYYTRGGASWDGTTVSASLSGSGTEVDPYLITCGADLAYLRDRVNSGNNCTGEYYKQTTIINLVNGANFMIANSLDYKFNGVYDGNNCRIKGLQISSSENRVGLFGNVGSAGVIKNLTVEGAVTSTFDSTLSEDTATCVGGIVGFSLGKVENCVGYIDITNPTCLFIGGVVGYAGTGSNIINCTNYGTITTNNGTVGGVLGLAIGKIENCTNYGSVSGKSSVGGVMGGCYHSNELITGCVNYGSVFGSDYNVGGIIGLSNSLRIQYCTNYGNISSYGTCVGGIVGTDTGSILNNNGIVRGSLYDCINYGVITGKKQDGTLKACIGGIAGISYSPLTNMKNYGEVIGSVEVGGIVGRQHEFAHVSNSVNYGDLNITQDSGGIVGTAHANITNCNNYGNIQGVRTHVGGIVGNHNAAIVSDCHNYGAVKGSWGVAGIAGSSKGTVDNCTNEGTIRAEGQAAGIVGKQGTYTTDSETGVQTLTGEGETKNCSNSGYIIASNATTTAGITGTLAGPTNKNTLLNTNTNTGYVSSGKQIVGNQICQ